MTENYNFWADVLNKYCQLTHWVQTILGLSTLGGVLGLAYFLKEIVLIIMHSFYRLKDDIKKLTGDIRVGQQDINGISVGGISNFFDNIIIPHKARNGCQCLEMLSPCRRWREQ